MGRGFESLERHHNADMAKLVDAPDLGSGAARRGGSSPSIRTNLRGIAQPGSALVLGTRGRWFESSYPDHFRGISSVGRAIDLHSIGHRFDPGILHQSWVDTLSLLRGRLFFLDKFNQGATGQPFITRV